jgi:hypothetical protein
MGPIIDLIISVRLIGSDVIAFNRQLVKVSSSLARGRSCTEVDSSTGTKKNQSTASISVPLPKSTKE